MVLHEKKFELLQHEPSRNAITELLYELPFVRFEVENIYSTSNSILEPSHLVRDLGIYISKNLSWSPHIATISDGARKTAAWVLSVFQNGSAVVMLQLYKRVRALYVASWSSVVPFVTQLNFLIFRNWSLSDAVSHPRSHLSPTSATGTG